MDGNQLPHMVTPPPGPVSSAWISRLAATECPAITARRARREHETGVPQDPIVWVEAIGSNVKDVDGNVYVDMTAAFSVSGLGHRHPAVVAAAHAQVDRLIHAMGDVYPSDVKIAFCERLAQVAPGDLQQSILGLSGADAVAAALKTAVMATGKSGVIGFWGCYHGLSYGALPVTAYKRSFREPFLGQLNQRVRHFPYPDPYRQPFGLRDAAPAVVLDAVLTHLRDALRHPASGLDEIGALVVEPILGRGGEVVPPDGFLRGLRDICDEFGIVLVFDEIFTGFARTGRMFACEYEGVVPDLLCVGKALGGGFPVSAVVGKPSIMQGWGNSKGEAIHTSTFLGNPLGCAMGLAALETLTSQDWPQKVEALGQRRLADLQGLAQRAPAVGDVRGRGLMLGVDLVVPGTKDPDTRLSLALMDTLRADGYLILPSGTYGNVLGVSPPFVHTDEQWAGFLQALESRLEQLTTSR